MFHALLKSLQVDSHDSHDPKLKSFASPEVSTWTNLKKWFGNGCWWSIHGGWKKQYLDNPSVQNYRSKSETAIIIAGCLNFRCFQFFSPFQFPHFGLLIFVRRFVGFFRRFVGFFRRFKTGKHMQHEKHAKSVRRQKKMPPAIIPEKGNNFAYIGRRRYDPARPRCECSSILHRQKHGNSEKAHCPTLILMFKFSTYLWWNGCSVGAMFSSLAVAFKPWICFSPVTPSHGGCRAIWCRAAALESCEKHPCGQCLAATIGCSTGPILAQNHAKPNVPISTLDMFVSTLGPASVRFTIKFAQVFPNSPPAQKKPSKAAAVYLLNALPGPRTEWWSPPRSPGLARPLVACLRMGLWIAVPSHAMTKRKKRPNSVYPTFRGGTNTSTRF